jgi:uncharacterized protein YwqG
MVTSAIPLPVIPEKLQNRLLAAGSEVLGRVESFLATSARPCVYFDSERVGELPLRHGVIGRLLKRPLATPQLPVLASKFGGRPYVPAVDVPLMRNRTFLLQINLEEVPELPAPIPQRGLLAVDMDPSTGIYRWVNVRYYPDPSEAQAADLGPTDCVGKYEAVLRYVPGLSYPEGEVWESVLAGGDAVTRELWDEWQFEIDGTPHIAQKRWRHSEEVHRIGGYRTCAQDDAPFEPPEGLPADIAQYELLLRISFDNTADFGWGSNTLYLVIHRDDLAAGRLERAFGAPANA